MQTACSGLLCPPLEHFPWFHHVQDSRSTRHSDDGCRTLSHAGLDFSFHFSFIFSTLVEFMRITTDIRLANLEAVLWKACVSASISIVQLVVKTVCPRALTFTWWGCCGLCFRLKPTELVHSFSFCSCDCFCLYVPCKCISFHKFSRKLSAFSFCSSGLISVLLVLSTIYLFMKSTSALV